MPTDCVRKCRNEVTFQCKQLYRGGHSPGDKEDGRRCSWAGEAEGARLGRFLRDSRADTKPAMNTQRWIPGERLARRGECGCCRHRAGSKQVEMEDMAEGTGQKPKGPALSIRSLHAQALRGDESENDPEELPTLNLTQNQRAWCRRRQVTEAFLEAGRARRGPYLPQRSV